MNTLERIALAGDVAQWGAYAAASSYEDGRLNRLALVIWRDKVNYLMAATQRADGWDWGFSDAA